MAALIAICLTISAWRNNGQETYTASSTYSNTPQCNLATPNDTCNLYCDTKSPSISFAFDCGNAGICNFYCQSKYCFRYASTLDAVNSQILNVINEGAISCIASTINVPNYGNAYFHVTDDTTNPFDRMTVNAGINTNEIYINCSKPTDYKTIPGPNGETSSYPDCNSITINAESAQYLYIDISNNGYMYSGQIYCPKNSQYKGTSCMIDSSNNGIISHLNIYASKGLPTDVIIYPGNTFSYVNIICNSDIVSGIWTNVPTTFPTNGICYYDEITLNPTTFVPTTIPTTTPTLTPQIHTTIDDDFLYPKEEKDSNLESQQEQSLLLPYSYRDVQINNVIAIGTVVLFCSLCVFVWNWRRHKLWKDEKLGYVQSKIPMFTDTVLLLWGLGSGYGIIFAVKSPFYELLKVKSSIGIVFKGVVAILTGFTIGFVHVHYESENDYNKIKKSFYDIKNVMQQDPKIINCNFKDCFLIFWSIFSGYGIIFAIESWIYEITGLKTPLAYLMKVIVAIMVGFGLGAIHFYFDILQDRLQICANKKYIQCKHNKSDVEFDSDEEEIKANYPMTGDVDVEISIDQIITSASANKSNGIIAYNSNVKLSETNEHELSSSSSDNDGIETKFKPKKIIRYSTSPTREWKNPFKLSTKRSKTTVF